MAKKKETPKTVGVIGLGNMGKGIARNLAKAGHEVLVWDISDEARKKLSRVASAVELSLIHI